MTLSSSELSHYLVMYFWPFVRIAGLIMVAPVFSSHVIPMRFRVGMAAILTAVIVPMLDPMPAVDPVGAAGLLIAVQQLLIGMAMGFMLKIVFSALELGGHAIGQTMGLGFAQMMDPANGITVPVISQFYTVVATLAFLGLNGHLVLLSVLVESFRAFPVGTEWITGAGLWALLAWSGWIFKGAVLMALPAVLALLLVNVSFGVMMRAAPQLNIFSIGFPLTLMLGLLFIMVTLPIFVPQFSDLLDRSLSAIISEILR